MSRNSFRLAMSLLLLVSLLLTACGPAATEAPPEAPPEATEAPPEEPEAPPAEKVVVQIFVGVGTGTSPEQIEQEEMLSDEFNATHDDIEIETSS